MSPELRAVADGFVSAQDRLHRLAQVAPREWWPRRPIPRRWSIAECVAHLTLAAEAYLPLLRDGIASARRLGGARPARYRRDPVSWFLWRTGGPPVRVRVRTTARFVPAAARPADELLADFARLQAAQLACVTDADGLPLTRVRVVSPFDARIRYNLYGCLTLLPVHQHRHLWQAEQVLEELHRRA